MHFSSFNDVNSLFVEILSDIKHDLNIANSRPQLQYRLHFLTKDDSNALVFVDVLFKMQSWDNSMYRLLTNIGQNKIAAIRAKIVEPHMCDSNMYRWLTNIGQIR